MNSRPIPQLEKIISANELKPFSEIRLIALDLDGTLLDSNNSPLPDRVKALAGSLRHHSIKVYTTIATGRTLEGARPLIDDLGLSKDTPIVIYNGSVVINNDNKIFEQKKFTAQSFSKIIDSVRHLPVKVLAYSLFEKDGVINEDAHGWSNIDMPVFDYNSMLIKWHEFGSYICEHVPSTIVIHTKDPKIFEDITSSLNCFEDVICTYGSSYIEVCPKNAQKGTALERVAKLLGLTSKQVLAMGDNHNDASMLKWAGIGVAVKNASSIALENSNYVSNYGVMRGAIEVLQVVLQAHKTLREKRRARERQASLLPLENVSAYYTDEVPHGGDTRFISEFDIHSYLMRSANYSEDCETVEMAIKFGMLPRYNCGHGEPCFLNDDFLRVFQKIQIKSHSHKSDYNNITGEIVFDGPSRVENVSSMTIHTPAFFPAITNIISYASSAKDVSSDRLKELDYIGGSRLLTNSESVLSYAKVQMERIRLAEHSELSHDARNPYYMGSKRSLCGFIVEAIMPFAQSDSVLVDLMCGSGVVTGAFNQFWDTYASDSQWFCRQLAKVHGGGFSKAEAKKLLNFMIPIAGEHFTELSAKIPFSVKKEMDIFCSETSKKLALEYDEFIRSFPTITNKLLEEGWDPLAEVEIRRRDCIRRPYCLFTAYFANTFFGVRQSIEIDSLRYAMDQIHDSNARDWALGALISTLSSVGTTHGGHFAQPKYKGKDISCLSSSQLSKLFDTRSYSIMHDFSQRLLAISKLSESRSKSVETVQGPWMNSLNLLSKILIDKQVFVYLDPPYTRDDYSRYYHVLETLVKYNYPTCNGKGLTPEPSDRFRSEFSKRNAKNVADSLVEIVSRVLHLGWSCVWSYSDSGKVDIHSVVDRISKQFKCSIRSFSTPFVHKSLGKASYKDVVEYIVIITPS